MSWAAVGRRICALGHGALVLLASCGLDRSGLLAIDADSGPGAAPEGGAHAQADEPPAASVDAAPGPATSDGGLSAPGDGGPAESSDRGPAESSDEGPATSDDAVAPATCGSAARCVPAAPVGWLGPAALLVGPTATMAPACPSPFAATPAFVGVAGLVAPPAQCTGCVCGHPSGTACTGAVVALFTDGACAVPCATAAVPDDPAACAAIDTGACGAGGVRATVSEADFAGGACAPGPAVPPVLPPIAWSELALACAPADPPSDRACGAGAVCAPTPAAASAAASSAGPCILQAGDVACPAGSPYAMRSVFFDARAAPVDTRSCSDCGCGAPAGGSCSETRALFFDDAACDSKTGDVTAPATCSDRLSDQPTPDHVQRDARSVASGGACAPTGGQPVGAVVPSGATTFCCLP